MMALQVTWFFLIGILLTVYAVLDGFDLGAGFWHLFTKTDEERRTVLRAIGPVWDGNEVWLLTGGGALFAAFPHVYATVFSGFYLPLMLVLTGLIVRAVAVEFRSKSASPLWRKAWDAAFALASILASFLFGVALGNVIRGVPIDETRNFAGTFFGLLTPYPLLIGLTGLFMLAMHGAIYLAIKTEGELSERARHWAQKAWAVYLVLLLLAMVVTIFAHPRLLVNYQAYSVLWIIPLFVLTAVLLAGLLAWRARLRMAFLFSSLAIAGNMGMTGASLYPNLVPALDSPLQSLTLFNSSSSALTLKTMLIIACIGVPVVLIYTIWVYRTFGGKVRPEQDGY